VGETNVGRKRTHNEDNFSILTDFGLYIVADGMGGHASGEVASKLAIDTIAEFFADTADDPERTWPYKMDRAKGYEENRLITGIKLANLRIFEFAQRDVKTRGMGTTIVSIFTVDNGVYCAHVGDSRSYRIRNGIIEQITEDHSLLNDYIKMKHLTAAQKRHRARPRHERDGQGRHALRRAATRRRLPALFRRPLRPRVRPGDARHHSRRPRPEERLAAAHRPGQRARRARQHHLRARPLGGLSP
jgi:serine/threonine protein phosphatase PrpC